MKYLSKQFSVAMPGTEHWPFEPEYEPHPEQRPHGECAECGAVVVPGRAHVDARDEAARKARKRVCFGKVVAS
jgi:hypothetical protein